MSNISMAHHQPYEMIRILHVDDEPDFADMTATFLEEKHDRFEVKTATSASKGIDRLSDSNFDCIVSDYDMPDQNGIQFLEAVREDYPNLPFLLYTGKGSEEIASDAISAGVTDYLQKDTGTSQYIVLTNRIRNAVKNYRIQNELADREQRLNLFFEQSPLGVIEWDENFDFVRMNEAAENILGYTEDDLIGRSWEAIVPESDQDAVDEVVANLLKAKGGYHSVNDNVRKNGERIVCEWHNRVVTDDSGDTIAIFSQFQDITNREKRAQELETRTRRLEAILNNTTTPMFMKDDEGRYIFVNKGYRELFGLEDTDIIGRTDHELHPPEMAEQAQKNDQFVLNPGESVETEKRIMVNGRERIFLSTKVPIYDTGNRSDPEQPVAVFGVASDITELEKRKRELRETKRRLDLVLEETKTGIWEWQIGTDNVEWDETLERLFGLAPGSFEGTYEAFAKRVHPDDLPEIEAAIDHTIEADDPYQTEFRMIREDGEIVWSEARGIIIEEDDGPDRIVGLHRDISDRKEREQELHDEQAFIEQSLDTLDDIFYFVDTDGDFQRWNSTLPELTGYSNDEIGSMNALEFFEGEHREAISHSIHEILENGSHVTEADITTAEGRHVPHEFRGVRMTDDEGGPAGIIGIARDITERKERERQLQQKTEELERLATKFETQYRTLFEEAPVMTALTRSEDGQPIIEDCNSQFAETLGYEEDAILGSELAEFYTPESTERLISGGYKRSLNGEFTREKRDLIAANGEIVETHLRAVPRRTAGGDMIGTVAMYIDITEREAVKRVNERLEEFTSIVSHDLRNPLNIASTRLELATEECENEHLDHVEQALDRMGTLIDDLLTLAREGREVTDPQPVDFATLIEVCWGTVETSGASLNIDIDREVRADRSRLKQVFENLFRNAVEHGGEDVTVRVGELDDGFYIEDDGVGIPVDERDEIFKAGYSGSAEGTGFGLSIIEQVVTAHGWQIRVTDGSDGGTRFEITDVEFAE